MKEHLKFHLAGLNPNKSTELLSKCEAVEWAFQHGYLYRKVLELKHRFRVEAFSKIKQPFNGELISHEMDMGDNRLLPLDWIKNTLKENENSNTLDKLLGKFPETSEVKTNFHLQGLNPEIVFDEAAHITSEQWDEINKNIPVTEEVRIAFFKDLKAKIGGEEFTFPEPKTFSDNEISMKLFDAKFRGIIDGEQLNKLLDYFEDNKKEEDED